MFPSGCFHLLSEAISPYRGPTYHVVGWIFHFHPYPSNFFFWEWASWVIEREGFGLCASWKYTTSSWLILLSSEFPNFTASTFRVMIITLKIIEGVVIVGSPRQEYMNIYIHIDRYTLDGPGVPISWPSFCVILAACRVDLINDYQ